MAPIEVIDLISDSEDEDNLSGQAASSMLKSFQPHKDKQLPKAHANATAPFASTQQRQQQQQQFTFPPHAPPSTHFAPIAPLQQYMRPAHSAQQYAPIVPSTQYAPAATNHATIAPRSVQQHTNVGSDFSISGILKRGLQSAARSAGFANLQHVTAPQRANVERETPKQSIGSQENFNPSKVYEGRYAIPESDVNLREALAARHPGGPLQEERQRHFEDYHRKEAERKGVNNLSQGHAPLPSLAPESTSAAFANRQSSAAVQQSLSSSVNNIQPLVPHGRRSSSQANGNFEPAAKRPKLIHSENAEDSVGMREARRLSAARIGMNEARRNSQHAAPALPGLSTSHEEPTPVDPVSRPEEGISRQTAPTPAAAAVVGPMGLDQSNENMPTNTGIPPENNISTEKAKGKQKTVAMESTFGLETQRGKPRKPPQPKSKSDEGAKRANEWNKNVMRAFEKSSGLEVMSDTEDDAPNAVWEEPQPKPNSTAQHLDDSDSDCSSPNVAPSGSKPNHPTEIPSDGEGFSPLFVPERCKSGSPADSESDGDDSSPDVVPAKSQSKGPVKNRTDTNVSSADIVPARIKPSHPSSGAKTTKTTFLVEGRGDSDSSSPDVIPARSKPTRPPLAAKTKETSNPLEDRNDSGSSASDVVPARSGEVRFKKGPVNNPRDVVGYPDVVLARPEPTRPSLGEGISNPGFDVEALNDSDSSSPDFVPAKSNSECQSAKRGLPETVPRTNDALKNLLSQPGESASGLAITNDKGHQARIETNAKFTNIPQPTKPATNNRSNHGVQYSKEEDDLLKYLREVRKVSWEDMIDHFAGRTRGSLQVRYSTKLKNRSSTTTNRGKSEARVPAIPNHKIAAPQEYAAPARRAPKTTARNDGFVSWAQIKAARLAERSVATSESIEQQESMQTATPGPDAAIPASIPRLLRSREIGNTGGRNWSSKSRLKIPDQLQNHVLDTLGPRKFFHGASRDVTCVAWANDGNRFAAGAIAIDDERSMQYNRPNNLLLGNNAMNSLQELPEHHVPRPAVSDSNNVNSLHAMQETQDPRLFKTVAAVTFSGDSQSLYSAGGDGVVRMYDSSSGDCKSSFSQGAEVVLLAANSRGNLASGCHRSDDGSISILSDRLDPISKLGPSCTDVQSSLPIFPSALKWGVERYSGFLLAGFASDSYDEDRLAAGEVCLWDLDAEKKIELPTVRNVFDVAWNPSPSAASSLFAVACTRPGKRYRSSIQCFAPHQGRARAVISWDCQAFDINDVVYCPHDDNLIAAGATDGKVYIWDKRYSYRGQAPLHIFAHGKTKNVLDPERDPEIADTGVRFLSWSATGNRLYSGSSDGTVKIWNPYCTTENALVKDVATFNSAIMSGAFSPDYCELLIGEDQGQLNLLGIDREERSVRAAKKFDYYPASPATGKLPSDGGDKLAPARELLTSQQIEFRPMGALPKRQAVQGPNYHGPFLASSDEHRQHLLTEYQLALQQQKTALASLPRNAETDKSIKSAKLQVSQTRDALQRAQRKVDDAESLATAAALLQDHFRKSRHEWKKGKIGMIAKTCRLGCNYLPAAGDEDGEVPDDRRSEQRVPSSIRPQREVLNAGDMTNSEVAEAEMTSRCIACTGPAAKPKRGLPLCEACSLSRSGLTSRCEQCATPIRPNLNEGDLKNICERCNFHCFRCGSVAAVSAEGDTITCDLCGIQWEAGALGYEVKCSFKPLVARVRSEESLEQEMESLEQRMVRLFGDDERERLAGGWKVALVDGMRGL